MYLKRLEIQGFKSFPEKINLEFNNGITAVVGPNGSGKSNISDAIRWVLGEQSAKSLRGSKMEDIIFTGTQNRRPLNFAEVALTIDNSDHALNIDFSEITVVRRVYRSGESQYLINDTQCRLKDIRELFMDTGIGKEGYSIISQGKIDEILSTKGEDRRLLFEEAAGIVKYKSRKKEAETKLIRQRENMIRVEDIISEIETHSKPLKRQAEKTRTYLDLYEQLKLIKINLFTGRVNKYESETRKIDSDILALKNKTEEESNHHDKTKEDIENLKNSLGIIEEKINTINENSIERRSALEEKQSNIKLLEQKNQHALEDIKKSEDEIGLKKQIIETEEKNRVAYNNKLDELNKNLYGKEKEMEIINTKLEIINNKLEENEKEIDEFGSIHIEKLRLTSDTEGRVQRANTLYEQLESRLEELKKDSQLSKEKYDENLNKLKQAENLLDEKSKKQDSLEKESLSLNNKREEIKNIFALQGQNINETERKLNDAISRHKLLVELENNYEGFYKSVKTILKQKKHNPEQFSGIKGAIAEIISTDEKYETVIEMALGGSIQNIVTETEEDAEKAIAFLKKTKSGRATFLPLTSIKPNSLNSDMFKNEKGFIGLGNQLVTFDPIYENIISYLLGRVLIFDNIKNGVAFSRKKGYRYRIATIEGEIINIGGSLTGGSVYKGQSNILSRSREIDKLKQTIEDFSIELNDKKEQYNKTEKHLSYLKEQINKNRFISRELEIEKINLHVDVKQLKSIIEELERNKNKHIIEEKQLIEQLENANKNINGYKEEYNKIQSEINELSTQINMKQENLQKEKFIHDEMMEKLTQIKITVSSINENIKSTEENIKRIINDIKNFNEDIIRFEDSITNYELQIESNFSEIKNIEKEIELLKEKGQESDFDLLKFTEEKKDISNKINTHEKDSFVQVEIISDLKNELTKLELQKENFEENFRRLYDEMWEEYSITYNEALKYEKLDKSEDELKVKSGEIKNKIKNLGSVNPNAVEEYDVLMERLELMTTQRDDIIEAEEKLIDIINELNKLMKEQFLKHFEIISENFGVVFTEMFGGGTAYLELDDSDDALETDIKIISQPPGKKLQNMMLFSGGERALTAIALLFAILRMKPSPFCVLDEIDTALDDANVQRFANYLHNFESHSQFILITHRKGTMEAADALYGVTMQEQGVSKLVSVAFSEAANA